MNPTYPLARKAVGFVVRRQPDSKPTLLVWQHVDKPQLSWRLPGGGLQHGEGAEVGLLRELREEVGDYPFRVVRKLGIQRYFKRQTRRNVERHDFLVYAGQMPDQFVHQDRDPDLQTEEFMRFQWLGIDALQHIDPEHREVIRIDYVPELFMP